MKTISFINFNFFKRIFPSWFGITHTRLYSYDYFRERGTYFSFNSIYLDNIINKIATDVALLKFRHVRVIKDENNESQNNNSQSMIWEQNSDLSYVLNISANKYQTPFVFWSSVIRKMLNDGIAIVVPVYEYGKLNNLQLAECITEFTNNNEIVLTYNDKSFKINIEDLWIFENPKKNLSAALTSVSRLIDDNLKAIGQKLSISNQPLKGLLKVPTTTDDERMKSKAENRVNNILNAASSSGIGYLQKGEEFQELRNSYESVSDNELEFLKNQLYQAFGLNEKLFNCDYTESQYRAYFSSVLKVYQRVISQEINRKYFTKTAKTQGHKLIVYYDMYDISSLKDLNEFAFKTKYAGILNANEIREIFGYGSYNGGDIFETNKNAVRVGGNSEDIKINEDDE